MATSRATVVPMKMTQMKAAQVPNPGADFQIVEREIPKPDAGHVRIKVQACGVCHSDVLTKEGLWPGIQYPRVPGHEVAGIVDELGAGVSEWKKGQRVGVGWHGGHDNTCRECRRGDFRNCRNQKIAGISYDGGYQQYMVAPVEALVAIPESLSDFDAAPLLCAGITTYNALRHSGAFPGDLVAVQGIGGLGHLGIQFANKFGYKVAAIGRGSENAALSKKLGANVYIDSKSTNAAEALQKLGGAQVILATAPSSKAMSELIDGLGPNGKLMVIGATFDPIEVTPIQLISGSRTIQGWAAGTPADSEDTLRFAELTGVRPMIETYPLEKAAEAYARMLSGKQISRRLTMRNLTNDVASERIGYVQQTISYQGEHTMSVLERHGSSIIRSRSMTTMRYGVLSRTNIVRLFVDAQGRARYHQFGEGGNEQSEHLWSRSRSRLLLI